jgi:hypothetical protein
MTSEEMQLYGETHDRPDLVLHSVCRKERERLDALSDEFVIMTRLPLFDRLPHQLKNRVSNMNIFLLSGCWNAGKFPEDGAIAEARRIQSEVAVVCDGLDHLHYLIAEALIAKMVEDEDHSDDFH